MLDVGPSPSEVDSLMTFVDRLGAAGTDAAAARAHERIATDIAAGVVPPGLRRLAEGLSAGTGAAAPPPPRRPADDPASVAAAVRDEALIVLEEVGPDEVAAAVAALVDDGRRIAVTGADAAALAAVRRALPAAAADRAVDALPALTPADLHRLRGLLATSTPARQARAAQQLPPLHALPAAAEVDELCAVAARPTPRGTEELVPLLAELDADRRAAVTALAGEVARTLTALGGRGEPWTWELLADLVHGRRRPAFDAIVQSAAQALTTIDDGRDDPPVRVVGPLPADAVDVLVDYLEVREAGGRTRGPFRSVWPSGGVPREVVPVLRRLRVGDREPESVHDLRVVLTWFELREKLLAVDADCAALGLPTPQNPTQLRALSDALRDVGAAARSVGALRHDVLFLDAGSPLAVPDVAAAEALAIAVLDYAENGSATEAGRRLDALAHGLAAHAPPGSTAPEHARAVAALRARDAPAYRDAVQDLVRAHRELCDEQRTAALLTGLGSPTLAAAWDRSRSAAARTGAPVRSGFAWFRATPALLADLPPADRVDVVVVVDAAGEGVDRALLAAAAPRVVAAVARGGRSHPGSLLGLLHRAGALVIRGRSPVGGRVVPLPPAPRPRPVPGHGGVGQAGA